MDMGKGAPALRPAAGAARLKSEGEHMVNYLIKRTLFALLLVLVVATLYSALCAWHRAIPLS